MIDLDELAFLRDEDIVAGIAILNARLPDDHSRKITRERIKALRDEAYSGDEGEQFLDALLSYLPPEG